MKLNKLIIIGVLLMLLIFSFVTTIIVDKENTKKDIVDSYNNENLSDSNIKENKIDDNENVLDVSSDESSDSQIANVEYKVYEGLDNGFVENKDIYYMIDGNSDKVLIRTIIDSETKDENGKYESTNDTIKITFENGTIEELKKIDAKILYSEENGYLINTDSHIDAWIYNNAKPLMFDIYGRYFSQIEDNEGYGKYWYDYEKGEIILLSSLGDIKTISVLAERTDYRTNYTFIFPNNKIVKDDGVEYNIYTAKEIYNLDVVNDSIEDMDGDNIFTYDLLLCDNNIVYFSLGEGIGIEGFYEDNGTSIICNFIMCICYNGGSSVLPTNYKFEFNKINESDGSKSVYLQKITRFYTNNCYKIYDGVIMEIENQVFHLEKND